MRAIGSAEKAVQLKPDFVLARDVLSRLYLESGQTAKAIAQCRATLQYNGSDQVALYRLIRALRAENAKRHEAEISQLLQSLAKAREQARQKEVEASQYKLVETPADALSKKPQACCHSDSHHRNDSDNACLSLLQTAVILT